MRQSRSRHSFQIDAIKQPSSEWTTKRDSRRNVPSIAVLQEIQLESQHPAQLDGCAGWLSPDASTKLLKRIQIAWSTE
jgi:hypothetical protein